MIYCNKNQYAKNPTRRISILIIEIVFTVCGEGGEKRKKKIESISIIEGEDNFKRNTDSNSTYPQQSLAMLYEYAANRRLPLVFCIDPLNIKKIVLINKFFKNILLVYSNQVIKSTNFLF